MPQLIENSRSTIEVQPVLSEALNTTESALSGMLSEISNSSLLLSMGIKDNLASETEKILKDPLFGLNEGINGIKSIAWDYVKSLFDNVLEKSYPNEFVSIHRNHTIVDSIQYFIVLKEDSEANKDKLIDLIINWKSLIYGQKFPVQFHFVPIDSADKIVNLDQII